MDYENLFCDQCGKDQVFRGAPCSECGALPGSPGLEAAALREDKKRYTGIWWLFGLLCVTLVGSGMYIARARATGATVAAVVNGWNVPLGQVRQRAEFLRRLAFRHGRGNREIDGRQLEWDAVNELIAIRLIEDAARETGVVLSETDLDGKIAGYRKDRNLVADETYRDHVEAWYGSEQWFRSFLMTETLFDRLRKQGGTLSGVELPAGGGSAGMLAALRQNASVQVFLPKPGQGCCGSGAAGNEGAGKASCCATRKPVR